MSMADVKEVLAEKNRYAASLEDKIAELRGELAEARNVISRAAKSRPSLAVWLLETYIIEQEERNAK